MKMVLWDSAAGEQTQILFEKVMLLPPANAQLIISLLQQAYNLHDTNYPQCIYITSSKSYWNPLLSTYVKRKQNPLPALVKITMYAMTFSSFLFHFLPSYLCQGH